MQKAHGKVRLNWVTEKYDTNIVRTLNAAGRAGKYSEEVWKTATGKTSRELGDAWKKAREKCLGIEPKKRTPAEEKSPATKPR